MKRKPLIFNFKWNFAWILGQHDIFILGDVPLPKSEKKLLSNIRFELADVHPPWNHKFFFYPKLDLSWQMYNPPTRIEKKSSRNEILIFGLHSTPDDWQSHLSNKN